MFSQLVTKIRNLSTALWREVAKFGAVGGVAFIIDSLIFIWLMSGPMEGSEVKAKIVSGVVATLFSWVANRYWTFRHHRTQTHVRELLMFLAVNGIGLGIQSGCVFIAKYFLGMSTPGELFIAGSVVGLVIATAFRYIAYKFWVFTGDAPDMPEPASVSSNAGASSTAAVSPDPLSLRGD